MFNKNISVHLQDYPDLSFVGEEKDLVLDMDLIRDVCSVSLAIRDGKNLRVRLPLKSLTIIGKNSKRILPFKNIIAEEVNVKEVFVEEDFSNLAELKLQVNFKKIGAKHGPKIKDIIAATKQGNWQKVDGNKISICGVILETDEFDLKLQPKNIDEKKYAVLALPTNDYLVRLEIETTKDLEDEGIARDIIRAIQQNRKTADLDISDRISLKLSADNEGIIVAAKKFENYIKEQVLAKEILFDQKLEKSEKYFENKLEDGLLLVELDK